MQYTYFIVFLWVGDLYSVRCVSTAEKHMQACTRRKKESIVWRHDHAFRLLHRTPVCSTGIGWKRERKKESCCSITANFLWPYACYAGEDCVTTSYFFFPVCSAHPRRREPKVHSSATFYIFCWVSTEYWAVEWYALKGFMFHISGMKQVNAHFLWFNLEWMWKGHFIFCALSKSISLNDALLNVRSLWII